MSFLRLATDAPVPIKATANTAKTIATIAERNYEDVRTLRGNRILEVLLDLCLPNRLVWHANALAQLCAELSLDLRAQTLGHRVVCDATASALAKASLHPAATSQPVVERDWLI